MYNEYYLSDNGTYLGPFSFEQVMSKMEARELQLADYVFDVKVGEWFMFLEHPDFSQKLLSRTPERPKSKPFQVKAKSTEAEANFEKLKDKEWYVMKDENKCGPFCYLDLVEMLQKKKISEFDFVWHEKLTTWKAVADVPDFSPDNIRRLKDIPDQEISEIFFRRRHARISHAGSLIVHNNKTVFSGKVVEIGAGGAGIFIENAQLEPGQTLFLHFQPGEKVPPFNAVCEIVNKQVINGGILTNKKIRYGVKFTSVTQAIRESITNYATKKVA